VPTRRAGGIWAPGGPVIGPAGTIYVSVGNGAATSGRYDKSDSVTALSPRLRREGYFAPTTWAADNANDLDLGSMTPALLGDGRILAVGKRGVGYLLNARHLGGVGGQLAKAPVCASFAGAFGGAAVTGTRVYVPCEGGGLTAVSTARGRIRVLWRGPGPAFGSPVVGGGRVWVLNWIARIGILDQLSPRSGRVKHRIRLGTGLPHFASPSLSGRLVLVGTLHGVVAVRGA
jgi:polyvinyl alcohol dehydrogenase (cytochrome)